MNEVLAAALRFHQEGQFVIPCRPGTKRPLIKWGKDAKRLTAKALEGFWRDDEEPPDIGLRLDGKTLVLDLDPRHNDKVRESFEMLLNMTRCATTPSDGLHAFFSITKPIRPRTYRGLDVLTRGRMVIVPPSSGRDWTGQPNVGQLPEPEALIHAIVDQAGLQRLAPDEGLAAESLASIGDIPYHKRNQTLTAIAGVLRAAGFRGNRLEAALDGIVQHVVEQPEHDRITFEDVVAICDSIDWRRPRPFETRDSTRYEFNTSDVPPALEWLIPDFLPGEGVTSLFGMGKQGKSYIAMEVLRCLSTAGTFLELPSPGKRKRVLYVDWEKRGNSLRRRLYALASQDRLTVTVLEPHGALVNMIEPLRAEIALGGYDLTIIDSLTIAIMQGDVNEAATVVPAMFALNSLGCAVLALDHTKKPQMGEPYETLSAFGSVFKANVCSMNWRLKKVSGDAAGMNVVLQHVSNNYDVNPSDLHARIAFGFDGAGHLSQASVTRKDVEATHNAVWRHLSFQVEPRTVQEIAAPLGLTIPQTRRILKKLEEDHLAANEAGEFWVALQSPDEEAPE